MIETAITSCLHSNSLLNHIMAQFSSMAQTKAPQPLPSGMVETFSRLLAYTEIESFGIKAFISKRATCRSDQWEMHDFDYIVFASSTRSIHQPHVAQPMLELPIHASRDGHVSLAPHRLFASHSTASTGQLQADPFADQPCSTLRLHRERHTKADKRTQLSGCSVTAGIDSESITRGGAKLSSARLGRVEQDIHSYAGSSFSHHRFRDTVL